MLKSIKNTKIYEQVIDRIKGMIADGTLDIGDQLPTERFLAEQLHVSRTSIREALRAMEIIGLIECRQGEGNFVRESSENSIIEPMSIMFMLQKYNPYQITELRKVIEVGTIAQAAQRVTTEELENIGTILEKLNSITEEEHGSEIDRDFHYEIIKCSKTTS